MFGYLACRSCGIEANCADLISGLCPDCARLRAGHLAMLQRRYDTALSDGKAAAASQIAKTISNYERAEGVRLKCAVHESV